MISKDDVFHIAKLARLGITEKENEKFKKEISSILDYFKLLEEVDTSKILPTYHSTEEHMKKGAAREDKARPEEERRVEDILKSFPNKSGRYVKVKSVL